MATFEAKASPEKRLFISLITRDISLADAIVDLLDNSVNAAMKPIKSRFSTSQDFYTVFTKKSATPAVNIEVEFDNNHLKVTDNASGIRFSDAQNEVFRFGHSATHTASRDRLSVYGIGMKRAIFKIGKTIKIESDHKDGGFSLNLNVNEWERDSTLPWSVPIAKRNATSKTRTMINITRLNKEVRSRFADKSFEHQLIEKISKVYSFFIGRVVNVTVNKTKVSRTDFEIGKANFSHDKFRQKGVDCSILAGIATPDGDRFLAETAGWFVFCNYRTVLYADKSALTGWGDDLPLFQPKHRPFLGIVLFTSADPEALPWSTTKGQIDEDSAVWQEAKLRMVSAAKPVVKFLDKRYTDDGTSVEPGGIAQLAGAPVNVFQAAVSSRAFFASPAKKAKQEKTTQRIQYDAEKKDIAAIRRHLALSSMSLTDIGRTTFDYYLENEVEG